MNMDVQFPLGKKSLRWTPIGYGNYLKGIRRPYSLFCVGPQLEKLAERSWQIAPGSVTVSSKAFFFEDQLRRVTGMAYTDNPLRDMLGGIETHHAPTRAILLNSVWLLDGSLYKRNSRFDIHPRNKVAKIKRYFPSSIVDTEIDRASIYSSYDGNAFFGLWLTDDCSNYTLAVSEGLPVTSNQAISPHTLAYESLLDMKPIRTDAAFLKEAVFFDDNWGTNNGKLERFNAVKRKIQNKFPGSAHPGVFIVRGGSGVSRIMMNELEVAQHLREKRGFRIVDVNTHSVAEILAACAGARVLAGVEGSHLVHGLMVLPRGASVFTIQPPNRFCSVIKIYSDIQEQHYSFVVGYPAEGGFMADPADIERTLDLLPQ
jgi:hypothetical protein